MDLLSIVPLGAASGWKFFFDLKLQNDVDRAEGLLNVSMVYGPIADKTRTTIRDRREEDGGFKSRRPDYLRGGGATFADEAAHHAEADVRSPVGSTKCPARCSADTAPRQTL